ncbi:hypothetical protein ACFVH9_16260 [Streptomyces hirsutus]|uniref:hypothetical protein n=1 Tax=Streptomyces hirsutus TaxID=35620 RepID=UPI0036422E12
MASLEQVTVPAQDRVGAYQQQEVAQLVHGEVVEQAGEDSTVGVGECWLGNLALQDEQLVPQGENLHVFFAVAHRQET